MVIEKCGDKIRIMDSESTTLVDYQPKLHRRMVYVFILSWNQQLLEDLIWPDMPEIRAESIQVIQRYMNYELSEFINQTSVAERAAYEYAKMQLEPTDLSIPLDNVFDSLIEEGKIQFATEEDVKASVVPAPVTEEDFANLPIEDSRHPLNNVKVEIK